jgi:hypothetical protein
VTDAGGRFAFDFVPVGANRLTVSQSGFETGTRSGIELVSGQVLDLPIQLAIQQQTQSIEVQANAAALDTTEAQQVATLNETMCPNCPSLISTGPISGRILRAPKNRDFKAA